MAIITHFGIRVILKGPDQQAALIQEETGIPTRAATDGMRVTFDKEIHVGKSKKQTDLSSFVGVS